MGLRQTCVVLAVVLAAAPCHANPEEGAFGDVRRALRKLEAQANSLRHLRTAILLAKSPELKRALIQKARALVAEARAGIGAVAKAAKRGQASGEIGEAAAAILERMRSAISSSIERQSKDIPDPPPLAKAPKRPAGEPAPKPKPVQPLPAQVAKVQGFLDEIRLAQSYAKERFGYEGMAATLKAAFLKAGATDKHGWSRPWSTSLWTRTWNGVGGPNYKILTRAVVSFRAHIERDFGPDSQTYLTYLGNAMKGWRRAVRRRLNLMKRAVQTYARQAAAWEQKERDRGDALKQAALALEKQIDAPFPLVRGRKAFLKALRTAEKGQKRRRQEDQDTKTVPEKKVQELIEDLAGDLEKSGLPSDWLWELFNDPPTVKFDEERTAKKDNSGVYHPGLNTVFVDPSRDLGKLTPKERATLIHELFHAWHDMVPYWTEFRLTDAQEEAAGTFIDNLVQGKPLQSAMTAALGETEVPDRNGKLEDAFTAIIELDRFWRENDSGSLFAKGFKNARDRSIWELIKKQKRYRHLRSRFEEIERLLEKHAKKN
jgi:hypothetical protein